MLKNIYSYEKLRRLKIPAIFACEEIKVDDKDILNFFNCNLCCNLAYVPVFCNKCAKLTCLDCLSKYFNITGNCSCLFKCGGKEFRGLNPDEELLLDHIKLKCRIKDCPEFISYTNYNQHMRTCKYNKSENKKENCETTVPLYKMKIYQQKCKQREIVCNKCKKELKCINKEKLINTNIDGAEVHNNINNGDMKNDNFGKNNSELLNYLIKKVEEMDKRIKELEVKNEIKCGKTFTKSRGGFWEY